MMGCIQKNLETIPIYNSRSKTTISFPMKIVLFISGTFCELSDVTTADAGGNLFYIIPIIILIIILILIVIYLIWYFKFSKKYKGKYKPREMEISAVHVPIESMLLPGTDEKLV